MIALLHQHQREIHKIEHEGVEVEFIEIEPADVEVAQRLLAHATGPRIDELPPQTARLLLRLRAMAEGEADDDEASVAFTRREVRERLGVGDTQSKVHLRRLVDAEYLTRRTTRRDGVVQYSLAFDPTRDATGTSSNNGGK